MKKRSVLRTIFTLVLVTHSPALMARWKYPEESPAEYIRRMTHTSIDSMGGITTRHDVAIKVKTLGGAQEFSSLVFSYDPDRNPITEFKAKITRDGKTEDIPEELVIEQSHGYDASFSTKLKEIFVVFPQVRVGSVLEYTYVQSFPHGGEKKKFLSGNFDFGTWIIENPGAAFHVESEIPLEWEIIDPRNYLEVKSLEKNGKFYRTITLTKEAYFVVTEEGDQAKFQRAIWPTVFYSSTKSWDDYARIIVDQWNHALHDNPLAPSQREILEQVRSSKSSFEDKVDLAVKLLRKKIRYRGDYIDPSNNWIPRTFQQIEERGYGDCKDFSNILATIFTALGYRSNVALVNFRVFHYPLPNEFSFNHAIARIVDEKGRVFWVDSNNTFENPTLTRPEISGRQVIVLDGEKSRREFIPELSPKDNLFKSSYNYKPLSRDRMLMTFTESYSPLEVARYFDENLDATKDDFLRDKTKNQVNASVGERWAMNPHYIQEPNHQGATLGGAVEFLNFKTSAGHRFTI